MITVFGAFEMNTKLEYLTCGCFIDIHIINRKLHGCSEISSSADGTLKAEKIRAVMCNNIYKPVTLIIYSTSENCLRTIYNQRERNIVCSYFD